MGLILAFGISMIVFLPSVMQVKGNMSSDIEIFKIEKEKLQLFSNVIFNNYNYMFTQKACLLFSGTITLLLIPIFYLNKKIDKKEKVIYTLVIIFLLLPIISPLCNKIWHGMTNPNCFNYRYSFALIFMLILMAFRGYQNKDVIKKKDLLISIGIFLLITLGEICIKQKGFLISDGFEISYLSICISVITFLLMSILLAINCFIEKEKIKKISLTLLIITVIVDLSIGINSYQKTNNDRYFTVKEVTQYDKAMEKIVSKINCKETDRIIFIPDSFGSNMSLKYGYSNIGYFTSARNAEEIKNMYKLGYNIQRADGLWITSYSGTWFNYSLAGVKYYITREKIENNEIYGFIYEDLIDNEFYIYKSNNSLPFGYYISENIDTKNKNPFEIQNEIINKYGSKTDKEDKYFYTLNENTDVAKIKKNQTIKEKESDKGKIETININYMINAKEDIDIYIYSDINLQIYDENGKPKFEKYADLWSTEAGIKQIKHLNQGEIYNFTLEVEKEKFNEEKIYLYAVNNKKAAQKLRQESQNKFNIKKIESNKVEGMANFEEDGYLCFEIAYDDGWRAYVDGKKVDVHRLYDSYTGLELSKGEHEIKIYYIPRYLKLGTLITLVSISIVALFIYKKII